MKGSPWKYIEPQEEGGWVFATEKEGPDSPAATVYRTITDSLPIALRQANSFLNEINETDGE
jgi:hypothetical protein